MDNILDIWYCPTKYEIKSTGKNTYKMCNISYNIIPYEFHARPALQNYYTCWWKHCCSYVRLSFVEKRAIAMWPRFKHRSRLTVAFGPPALLSLTFASRDGVSLHSYIAWSLRLCHPCHSKVSGPLHKDLENTLKRCYLILYSMKR